MNGKRIREYGYSIGRYPTGELNSITDVPGVRVGHSTIDTEENKTGITVIIPSNENVYTHNHVAATHVINGFGKSAGLMQIDELGVIESPIYLTNTLNVGKVLDAAVDHMINVCNKTEVDLTTFNPVVLECNDSFLNNIQNRVVDAAHVREAIDSADVIFDEGAVGAGKGMSCHQLKGGIGSSSRIMNIGSQSHVIGVLVMSNHGTLEDFILDGHPMGVELKTQLNADKMPEKGSIIIIVATDLPVSDRQLKRILKRIPIGLSKTGSYIGHGSGEVAIGFTTAQTVQQKGAYSIHVMQEDQLDIAFHALAEAVEEAVLNSMVAAESTRGYKGRQRIGLGVLLDAKKNE